MVPKTIRHYVAMGDSLSEGFSDWGQGDRTIGFAYVLAGLLQAATPQMEWTNLGTSGARTADVLRAQLPRAVRLQPDLVTLVVGANDVPTTAAIDFRRTYGELISHLRSEVGGLIVVANLPDFAHLLPHQYDAFRGGLRDRVHVFNQIIAELATANGTLLVDLHTSRESEDPRNLSGDGFHPNARGYRAIARAFAERLNQEGFDL
ncbi:MAG TPA: SGNH/GDSL hydrolase family protein, partial [Herpetosiphonaceae bacterium]|nr:SGNH/GDSL hydrolase family protein [Herpetosiphonaceae bacterium]